MIIELSFKPGEAAIRTIDIEVRVIYGSNNTRT